MGNPFEDSVPYGLEEAAAWADQDRRAQRNGQCPPQRRLILTPASKITPRPVRWVWDTTPPGAGLAEMQGRFPAGSLVLAVGRAGLGKSQFVVWMAAQITNGTLPGCHYRIPRSVVYCATEDSWEMTIVPRLMAAGADLDRVFHVRVAVDGDPYAQLTLPADTHLLEAAIAEHQVALVALDPLLSLLDHQINDYRAREVRHALEPVVAVADRTRCLFLGLAHFTKATGGDPLLLVSGSGAFGQLIRAGVGFARDEEAEQEAYVLSQIKNNLGRERLPSLAYVLDPKVVDTPEGPSVVTRFRFTGESERSVRDLLRGYSEDQDAKTEQDEAVEWLAGYLTGCGGEAPRKDVLKAAKAEGFSEATLKRAMRKAGVQSERVGFPSSTVWKLTPVGSQSAQSAHTPEREPTEPTVSQLGAQPPSPSLSSSTHGGAAEPATIAAASPQVRAAAQERERQEAANRAEASRVAALVDRLTALAGGGREDRRFAGRLAVEAPDLAAAAAAGRLDLADAAAELERRQAEGRLLDPGPEPEDPARWTR